MAETPRQCLIYVGKRGLDTDRRLPLSNNCHFERREKSAFYLQCQPADFSPDEAGLEMTNNKNCGGGESSKLPGKNHQVHTGASQKINIAR